MKPSKFNLILKWTDVCPWNKVCSCPFDKASNNVAIIYKWYYVGVK